MPKKAGANVVPDTSAPENPKGHAMGGLMRFGGGSKFLGDMNFPGGKESVSPPQPSRGDSVGKPPLGPGPAANGPIRRK